MTCSDKSHQTNVEISPSFNNVIDNKDLTTQILIRLPPKSLFRCKSVCKGWYSIISEPSFSSLFIPKSLPGFFLPIACRGKHPEYEFIDISGKKTKYNLGMAIMHSCNGLFLCCTLSSIRDREKCYHIYNPTTEQKVTLPRPVGGHQNVVGVNLAFDPSNSPHCKVVMVSEDSPLWHQVEIYSTETGTWKFLEGFSTHASLFIPDFNRGVFLNGNIHWLNLDTRMSSRFDVDRECQHTMPMPRIRYPRRFWYFGQSGGKLHFIVCIGSRSTLFDVFEMENGYSEWAVKYSVDLGSVTPSLNSRRFTVVDIFCGGVEEESSLVFYASGKVVSYNFKNKRLKRLCDLVLANYAERIALRSRWFGYIENIICVVG